MPTRAYAINAPSGPAAWSECPEPRKRPVPRVPAIYPPSALDERRPGAAAGSHRNHLDMALLEFPLDAIEVGRVEVVAVVGIRYDIVVHDAFLDGTRLVMFVVVVLGLRHGGQRMEGGGGGVGRKEPRTGLMNGEDPTSGGWAWREEAR